jgi:hypothetical protein
MTVQKIVAGRLPIQKLSDHMGHGAEVYSVSVQQEWKAVAPSVGQELWKVACGKK